MKPIGRMRWILGVLALYTCTAAAQKPAQILVTREAQDMYRVTAANSFYIKTMSCHEHVYEDRAGLRVNPITRGGRLIFRNGKECIVEKFLQELDPSKLNLGPTH
jgi:hypothetical protein